MREFKFRAWDNERGFMIDCDSLVLRHIVMLPTGLGFIRYDQNGDTTQVPNMIPMQYTGLKDKNGKDIYEGDIVIWGRDDITNGGEDIIKSFGRGNIVWSDVFAMFSFAKPEKMGCFQMESNEYEVIGNIYENPELMKGQASGEV